MSFKCPLCNVVSATGAVYNEHLETRHGLVDDEGTSTWTEPDVEYVAPIVRVEEPPKVEREVMLPWSSPKMDRPVSEGPVRRRLTRLSSYIAG